MLEKFRIQYEKKLTVKIVTVVVVVLLAMSIMLPLLLLAQLFGINLRENSGVNLKVDLTNLIFFLLFVSGSTFVIWAAQKYIHKAKLLDLGFRTKVLKFFLVGFFVGALKSSASYWIMMFNASTVSYTSAIPDDVSILTYVGYYLYFVFVIVIMNSFVEELVTRAYPIEKLRKHINPHIIFIIMGIIFTAGHFFTREFNFGYCLSLFIFSYTFSLLYHFTNSIWLVIGMHGGVNWVAFSFFGTNWQMGALYHIEMTNVPDWIVSYSHPIIGMIILIAVVFFHKMGLLKKLSS